ncbi:MAG: pyridoxal phosphate-dependent aminotransferase [Planctomycetes bacterium]|nr:pyridoxal phosphate-dependent aminotransferase [Planctomycetota bacterium]
MHQLGTESAFEVLARAKKLEAEGRSIINLGIGAPDFKTPAHIVEAGCQALRDGWHSYTEAKGLRELREAVAEDVELRRRVRIDPDQVLIVPGGKPTLFFAILMFGEPGAEILYPNPGFPIYESMIRCSGATPVPIALEEKRGFEFDPDEVLAKLNSKTRLIVVNTPANPTGGCISKGALERLAAGLERFPKVAILSDEIYARLVYAPAQHHSLLAYESIRERVILLDGWSKTFAMTGWRLGYGVWPKSLIEHAERLQINSNSCASAPVQRAGIAALRGPQEPVERMRRAFDERRLAIVDGLNELPGISCVTPQGAFYAFANITGTGFSSKELQNKLLLDAGVATVAGTAFGAFGEGYLRFSYANSLEKIREALARVRTVLESERALSAEPKGALPKTAVRRTRAKR